MIVSHSRGHAIYFDKDIWKYCDNNEPINEHRECKRCGCKPTKEGYDACIGHIEGVTAACCGHGIEDPVVIYG